MLRSGLLVPDDPFPNCGISPDLKDVYGAFLNIDNLQNMDFETVCEKILNRPILNMRVDTVWRDKLGLREETKPV